MKPSIDELFEDEQFVQLEVLPYSDMIPFVQREFRYPTPIIRLYWGINILIVFIMLGIAYLHISAGKITFSQLFYAISLGVALSLTLLIPLHEAIHGIAYKLVGAPKVSFGGSFRQFYFYAVADRFVVGARSFRAVALAPFVIISILFFLLLFFTSPFVQWICWGGLLMHTGACAGDFGMLGFYQRLSGSELFTFDDVAAQKAYFFQRHDAKSK